MIDGVKIIDLRKITDERGMVWHMLKESDPHFTKFGEIYFTCGYPGVVKAWHIHKEMTLNYACIAGSIKLVLYDNRKNSKTKNEIQEIILSPVNYFLVTVPPLIWNGFMNISEENSILANCSSVPYSDKEIIRKSPVDKEIPYKW